MANLYHVEMSDHAGEFYVVADDPGEAARLAETQWLAWSYKHSGRCAVNVELLAQATQYTDAKLPWLLPLSI